MRGILTPLEVRRELQSLFLSGMRQTEIAKRLGVSRNIVWKYTKKFQKPRQRTPGHRIEYLHLLRERRIAYGICQDELALIIGYATGSYIARLEFNRDTPSLPSFIAWVNALGGEIRIDWVGEPKRKGKQNGKHNDVS